MANRLICLQAVIEPPNRGENQGFLDRTSDRRVASQRGDKFRQRWPRHNRHSTLRSEPERQSVLRQPPNQREPQIGCLAAEPTWLAEN